MFVLPGKRIHPKNFKKDWIQIISVLKLTLRSKIILIETLNRYYYVRDKNTKTSFNKNIDHVGNCFSDFYDSKYILFKYKDGRLGCEA